MEGGKVKPGVGYWRIHSEGTLVVVKLVWAAAIMAWSSFILLACHQFIC